MSEQPHQHNKEHDDTTSPVHLYYLWQCAPSVEVKGWNGKQSGGCYRWNYLQSRKKITGYGQVQAKCQSCKRRPRLNAALVEVYLDLHRCHNESVRRNREGIAVPHAMKPNTTEVIE